MDSSLWNRGIWAAFIFLHFGYLKMKPLVQSRHLNAVIHGGDVSSEQFSPLMGIWGWFNLPGLSGDPGPEPSHSTPCPLRCKILQCRWETSLGWWFFSFSPAMFDPNPTEMRNPREPSASLAELPLLVLSLSWPLNPAAEIKSGNSSPGLLFPCKSGSASAEAPQNKRCHSGEKVWQGWMSNPIGKIT